MICAPLHIINDIGYPEVLQQYGDSSAQLKNSTPGSSTPSRSPSSSSPLRTLREKHKKKIRQTSGVKPKAKTPPMHSIRNAGAVSSSKKKLQMVRCQWADCTKKLHVDYVNIKHWSDHIREHYTSQPETMPCQWDGCDSKINKSSVWKHVVAHQPKFKLRCPHGCDVYTRADMMKRHLRTCPRSSSCDQAFGGSESDEEGDLQSGRVYRGDGCEVGSEDTQ